jgi:hypothetical protein
MLAPDGLLAAFIDPDRLHHPVHPAIKPGARLILRLPAHRAFKCILDKVVRSIRRARQGMAKPP